MEDLENRSRHNNLRLVGLPETVKMAELHRLCEAELPTALGLNLNCWRQWRTWETGCLPVTAIRDTALRVQTAKPGVRKEHPPLRSERTPSSCMANRSRNAKKGDTDLHLEQDMIPFSFLLPDSGSVSTLAYIAALPWSDLHVLRSMLWSPVD